MDKLPRVINYVKPGYPDIARKMGFEGRVTLKILIDDRGRVVKSMIIRIIGFDGFGTAAREAVKEWRFVPAEIQGAPVSVWAVQEIGFELD